MLLFPTPGDLLDPGSAPASLALAGGFFTAKPPGKPETHPQACTTVPAHEPSGGKKPAEAPVGAGDPPLDLTLDSRDH